MSMIFIDFAPSASNCLTGTIPSELGNLQEMQKIDLSTWQKQKTTVISLLLYLIYKPILYLLFLCIFKGRDNIRGDIPSELASIPNCNTIKLSDNILSGTIPSEFAAMSGLITLELANNKFSGTVPTEFFTMGSETIEVLNFGKNCKGLFQLLISL